MMRLILCLLASAAFAQSAARKPLTVTFNDGPVLELHTESSGGTSPLSTGGSVEVGPGHDAHRFVLDQRDKVLFGYYLEASRTAQGTVTLRMKPLDPEKTRQQSSYLQRMGDPQVPTLAATREFPDLHAGDEVQIDVLHNPATGEKLYDVIRVAEVKVSPRKVSKPAGELFSLSFFRVEINGKILRDTSQTWMIGGGLLISLPGRGDYYFSLAPCSETPCRRAAWVDRNVLRFSAGDDLVEVIAKANVLQTSEFRTLWTYHTPAAKPIREVDFTCGDDIDSLVRYRRGEEN